MEGWITVQLKVRTVKKLDKLKEEMGIRGRSEVIERLIEFYKKNMRVVE